jgi:hypothetical protein
MHNIAASQGRLEDIRDELSNWWESMPDSFADTPTGEKLDEAIDKLSEWIDQLDEMHSEAEDLELPIGYGRD